ncbi:MAG: DNA translocase FtsK [Bacteroidales bacterium]|jgi:S-DNA-T family DNA segregation ATPase FtsK/SpoIIIE|nr:DNA translocase FtsK [Bacteroidales bacterium]
MANQRNKVLNKSVSNNKKKKNGKKASKKNAKQPKNGGITFFKDDKFRSVMGILLLLFTIFLLLSFCSWLNTHDKDSDIYNRSLGIMLENADKTQPQNMMGLLGIYFSCLFMNELLGIASFGFILLGFVYGCKLLFKRSFLPLLSTTIITFSVMMLISTILAMFAGNRWFSGNYGFLLYKYISDKMSIPGFLLLWIAAVSVLLVVFGGINPRKMFAKKQLSDNEAIEDEKLPEEISLANDDGTIKVEQKSKIRQFFTSIFAKKEKKKKEKTFFSETIAEGDGMTPKDTPRINGILEEAGKGKGKQPETVPEEVIPGEDVLIDDIEPENTQNQTNIPDVNIFAEPEEAPTIESVEPETDKPIDYTQLPPYDPLADLPDFMFPSPDLLENYSAILRTREQKEFEIAGNKRRIKEALENYKIQIQSISAVEGPTITLYEIVPDPGIRISKIKGLEDDIALSLKALGIRIIAPMPGKGTIGIEVPNANPQIVPMKSVILSEAFQNTGKMALPVALGKTISNEVFVFDLAKAPHVLMAGATGQGKSVGLNAMLTSLLYKKHPAELKFVLVDPKKVELTLYSKIERHYLAKLPDNEEAIITDTKKVVRTLNSLCIEMDYRYDLLKMAQCRNIIEYNEKFKERRLNPELGHQFLPYIVLVFDEFADCIMTAGREVETPIARLAQLARAIGIHLIIATQRPSVNVITGLIKANFPARIAFKVSSKIDSRTILDTGGADNLIGKGDMLISSNGAMTRVQCALVDTPEIERICDFIGEQRAYAHAKFLPEVEDEVADNKQEVDDGEFDSMFGDAAREVVLKQQGSTSSLQRRFKLGYNRAGRIMDQLEREGIVGPAVGSKSREVLIHDINVLEQMLDDKGL